MTTTGTDKTTEPINVSDTSDDDDDVQIIQTLNNVTFSNSKSDYDNDNNDDDANDDDDDDDYDDDEPIDYPPKFTCELCSTPKPIHDTFRVKGCSHFYCSSCISHHVTKKIQESVTFVTCPFSGCEGFLEMESCKDVLERGVYERWGDLLCEEVILGAQRFNCPFEDCGALLINDGVGVEVVRESECPNCWRLFCVQCRVPWHGDLDCATFQAMRI